MPRFSAIAWASFSFLFLNAFDPTNSLVAQATGDTIRMQIEWEVAPGLHPTADLIGELSGLALDGQGNVYASDFLAVTIWVFGSDGGSLGSFGRDGEGPGEFEAPTGIAIGPNGRLYVRDVSRVSIFGPDSSTGLLTYFEDSFLGPALPDWRSKRTTRFHASGDVYYPRLISSRDGQVTHLFLRYSENGDVRDTAVVPHYSNVASPTAFYRTSASGGRMLPGLNHVPFAALPVWDVTPVGTVISGDGRFYELRETDSNGNAIRTFHRDVSLEGIPSRERADSVRALRARLDSVPVSLNQVEGMPEEVRSLEVPEVYPAYMAVHFGVDSTVWVRRWSPAAVGRSIFDVFSRSGDFLRTVVLPRIVATEPTPVLSLTDIVAIALDPDTDENIILRFRH